MIEVRQINKSDIELLVRNLQDFEKDKAIEEGLKKAGNVFKSGGQRRLRSRMKSGKEGVTGNLIKSFHVRLKRRKLGVLTGFNQGKNGGSHSHLVDRGTVDRYWKAKYRKSRGQIIKNSTKYMKSVGQVVGNNFWDDTRSEDNPRAIDKLYTGIEEAVARITQRR